MDNKIIEIFDYIGEKLGIAIDWTTENVMPQVTQLLGRYQVYQIATSVAWFAVNLFVAIMCLLWMKRTHSSIINKNKKSICYYIWDECGEFIIVIGYVAAIFVAACCAIDCFEKLLEVIEWAFVPEVKFFEVISDYLSNAS
jgi:hypothetical protein